MGVFSNKITRNELKQGDHIYSWRTAYIYSHHGIYVDEGKVIHFTRGPGQEVGTGTFLDRFIFSSSPASFDKSRDPCPVCGDQSDLSGVISSCLDCFLWEGELYRFEYGVSTPFFIAKARGGTCTLAPSDPPEDVIRRAAVLLQKGFGAYNLYQNNCEDFAIYCKTEMLVLASTSVGRSGQMNSIAAALSAVVLPPLRFLSTGFSGSPLVGCGMYCFSRFVSDIGVRRDVLKISVEKLVILWDLDQVAETVTPEKLPCHLDEPAETVICKNVPEEKLDSCDLSQSQKLLPDSDQSAESVISKNIPGETSPEFRYIGQPITHEKLPCDISQPAVPLTSKKGPGEIPCDLDQVAETVTPEKLPCHLDEPAETFICKNVPEEILDSCDLSQSQKLLPDSDQSAESVISKNIPGETSPEFRDIGQPVTHEKLPCDISQPAVPLTSKKGPGEISPESCDLSQLAGGADRKED